MSLVSNGGTRTQQSSFTQTSHRTKWGRHVFSGSIQDLTEGGGAEDEHGFINNVDSWKTKKNSK